MEPIIHHSSQLLNDHRKAPILTHLKWLYKNFPACPFLWCTSSLPHVLTGILSLFHEWKAVSCQVISILSISFWNIYVKFNMRYSFYLSGVCFGLFLYAWEISLGFFGLVCGFFSLFLTVQAPLSETELKAKTHTVASNPQLPSRAAICHLLSPQPKQAYTTQGTMGPKLEERPQSFFGSC